MRRLILAAALIALAGPAIARQDAPVGPEPDANVEQVLRSQGLLGVWSVNCRKPASRTNGRETIAVEGNRVVAIVEEDQRYVADVLKARALNRRDTEMHLREREYGVNYHVVYRRQGDRQMTWSSQDSDGEDLIANGRGANGQPSQWYRRCAS